MPDPLQSAIGSYNAQAYGEGASATVTITGYSALEVASLLTLVDSPAHTRIVTDLTGQLSTTHKVVSGFLRILKEKDVPLEQLEAKLNEIANRHLSQIKRLALFEPENDLARAYIEQAREVLLHVSSDKDYDRAETLFKQASDSQWSEIRRMEEFEREAHETVRRFRRDNAAMVAESAQLSLTRLDYLQAAEHYRAAAGLLAPEDAALGRDYFSRSANSLYVYGDEKGDNSVLLETIRYYRELLLATPRDSLPLEWASIQDSIGSCLWKLGERGSSTACLEEAVAAYKGALEERTQDRVPLDWALTQTNLGNALSRLGERDWGPSRLEQAVSVYGSALEERTRERVPLAWASAQNNLGCTLILLSYKQRDNLNTLEDAIVAFRSALEERTRERVPMEWADTHNNLGVALRKLGEHEIGVTRLEEAVMSFQNALKERTRKRVPLYWAITQNNLGNALRNIGEREVGAARLEEAVFRYRCALEVFTPEGVPLDWAMTQNNLCSALQLLGERETGCAKLQAARACLTDAWKVDRSAGLTQYDLDYQSRLEQLDELISSRSQAPEA